MTEYTVCLTIFAAKTVIPLFFVGRGSCSEYRIYLKGPMNIWDMYRKREKSMLQAVSCRKRESNWNSYCIQGRSLRAGRI